MIFTKAEVSDILAMLNLNETRMQNRADEDVPFSAAMAKDELDSEKYIQFLLRELADKERQLHELRQIVDRQQLP